MLTNCMVFVWSLLDRTWVFPYLDSHDFISWLNTSVWPFDKHVEWITKLLDRNFVESGTDLVGHSPAISWTLSVNKWFSIRCWQGPIITSGPCWCASTYRRKGYGTLSSQRKEKQSSTGRIGWRSPPYYDLCPQRCWHLSPPSAPRNRPGRESNPVELVYSECGNPTSSSLVEGALEDPLSGRWIRRWLFNADHGARQQYHHSRWEHQRDRNCEEDAAGRPRSPWASRDFNWDIAWRERPNGGRGDRKTA